MVRPSQETIALEKIACYSQFPRGEKRPCHIGPHKDASVSQEAEAVRGKHGQESLLWTSWERIGEAG